LSKVWYNRQRLISCGVRMDGMTAEEKQILKIINAYMLDGTKHQIPWHITRAGWEAFTSHPNRTIRETALQNPHCPSDLRNKLVVLTAVRFNRVAAQ
jgi:hypothetical protein